MEHWSLPASILAMTVFPVSYTHLKTSFNIGFALEILPQQLFLNGNSSMYYTDSQFELFEKKYRQIGQAPNTNRNASQTNKL